MTGQWYAERNDRSIRYAGRVLDPERWIVVRAELPFAARYDAQVALITAVNLLGRMTPSVALQVPEVLVSAPLPWAGQPLREVLVRVLRDADPACRIESHVQSAADYVLHVGVGPDAHVVHGSGWNVFAGKGSSPVPAVDDANPVGPSLAAIVGVSQVFVRDLHAPGGAFVANAWTWEDHLVEAPLVPGNLALGRVWSIGAGSVGTAILYFLTLGTRNFSSALFDMDEVKVHNLDRSPIFASGDLEDAKVNATARFLRGVGVTDVVVDNAALDESRLWSEREVGTPDLLLSAANERNVRPLIEAAYPPVQIYGTTGRNWQATMLRHLPMQDPCSCCVFPVQTQSAPPTVCAEGSIQRQAGQHIDAALPFLSFAAGAMAAAEILKLVGWPGAALDNRVVLATNPEPRFVRAPLTHRDGCLCLARDPRLYAGVLGASRYASSASAVGRRTDGASS